MEYIKFNSVLEMLAKSDMKVFTVRDVAKIMKKSTRYASLILSKNKKVHRLFKGTYYLEGTDAYQKASNIIFPCYISLSAALQYYDLIDQNIVKYTVITPKRHKNIKMKEGEVEFITLSKKRVFGYSFRDGGYIANLEKLFIDCLYLNKPDFNQINESFLYALKNNSIDIQKLKNYGLEMKSKLLINKLGFLLEHNGINADELYKYIYKPKYIELENGAKNKDRKWRILYDR